MDEDTIPLLKLCIFAWETIKIAHCELIESAELVLDWLSVYFNNPATIRI